MYSVFFLSVFSFECFGAHPNLHSFPTRRSSDLQQDQALAQLDRTLALNPHYIEAQVHRAIVLNELGREAEADAAFRRAAQVGDDPREGFAAHVAAKLANQHAALGDAYLGAGGLTQAIGEYQQALTLGPAFHDLRYKLGRMLLEAGRALDAG